MKKVKKFITRKLPKGAIYEISQKVNLSRSMVGKIINGKQESPKKPEILKLAAEYLIDYKTKEREAKEALQRAIEA